MKTAIVTGASSGIGLAVSLALAENGFRLLATGRNADALARLAAEHPGVEPVALDLTEPGACERLANLATERLGGLGLLVNNAGIYRPGDALETSDEDWRDTIAINLEVPFRLSRACLPLLLRSRGSIVNVASDWGLQGGHRAAAYCASKGGLVLLTRAMALDHAAAGVRVNAVCPGDVDTPMLEQAAAKEGLSHAEALQRYGAASPTGRVTHSEEVAALVCFLASEAAAQITGAAIPIDGGNTA